MKLDLILVDNVLRVGGRLDKAPLSYEARNPAILPHISQLMELVIRHFHERVAHIGVNNNLNVICQRYWINKAAVGLFTWSCKQLRSKGVLTPKELSAIEPKRERCSCVFTCALERLGWVFCAADFKLAALASRVN